MLPTSTSCKTKVIPAAAPSRDEKKGRFGEHLRTPRGLQGDDLVQGWWIIPGCDYMALMLTAPTKQILKPKLANRKEPATTWPNRSQLPRTSDAPSG